MASRPQAYSLPKDGNSNGWDATPTITPYLPMLGDNKGQIRYFQSTQVDYTTLPTKRSPVTVPFDTKQCTTGTNVTGRPNAHSFLQDYSPWAEKNLPPLYATTNEARAPTSGCSTDISVLGRLRRSCSNDSYSKLCVRNRDYSLRGPSPFDTSPVSQPNFDIQDGRLLSKLHFDVGSHDNRYEDEYRRCRDENRDSSRGISPSWPYGLEIPVLLPLAGEGSEGLTMGSARLWLEHAAMEVPPTPILTPVKSATLASKMTHKVGSSQKEEDEMWKSLLETKRIRRYPDTPIPEVDEEYAMEIEENFGIHQAGYPCGFFRNQSTGYLACRCKEGFFIFDDGFEFARLVGTDTKKVFRVLSDCDSKILEGAWRQMGSLYDKDAPDQLEEGLGCLD